MLRLSVVHAPVGPEEGPGLDDDIQEPGLEERDMYYGPSKYESEFPYGGKGEDREYDVPGKKQRAVKRTEAEILSEKSVVGIDFDGTVTADPKFFRELTEKLRSSGVAVHLITGRSYVEQEEVEAYCKMHSLNFSEKHYYPLPYRHDWIGWDTLVEVRIGSWKAKILDEIKAEAMIEDNCVFIDQIIKRLPNITVLRPVGGN